MLFSGRDGTPIKSLEQWRVSGKPASEHHWVPGRSAYELAANWIDGDGAARAGALISSRPEFQGLELQQGIAEKKTQFDDNPRGPRNHDLLVLGTTDAGPIVIGVEGKADEPFDLSLGEWTRARLANSPDSGAPARLRNLTQHFFGASIDDEPQLEGLGYQLLSALAGTMADARDKHATRAVVLIHEFVTDGTDDSKHAINARALDTFVARLFGEDVERTTQGDNWVTAPIELEGDGIYMASKMPVSFAKLVTSTEH